MPRFLIFFSVLLFVVIVLVQGIPKPDEVQDRVLHKDLSEQEHFVNSQHNPSYDHDAFLGEEAKTFDQLSPEESRRRLGIIVNKIDKDEDGFVTQEELKDWIRYTQQRYIQDDIDRQWTAHNTEGKETLLWDEYRRMIYGFMDDEDHSEKSEPEDNFSYSALLTRDRRRWELADKDGDDAMTKEEFGRFLHPEENEDMRDVIVSETMEDVDKDGDGKISITEYIGDIYKGNIGEEEPEWVKNEREQFSTYRDKDGDGFMDKGEVKNWIIPSDFDHAEAESRHLIYEVDSDADQKLTKEEILEKYDIFVGSQATDFGEALARHDEF